MRRLCTYKLSATSALYLNNGLNARGEETS